MKRRFLKFARFLCLLCVAAWATAPRTHAQTPPGFTSQFSGGQPSLSLTGAVGVIYSIQYATSLSATSLWTNRTLLQALPDGNVWNDPSAPIASQRFYRAVTIPSPANTNLVFIQPGTFVMGSPTNEVGRFAKEGPQTEVTLSRGFWMSKYLVTQGDYLALVGSNPSFHTPANGYPLDLKLPVEQVSWVDARNYCSLLTTQELVAGRIPTNCVYRLPTEAGW